jgi:hypothetical protein
VPAAKDACVKQAKSNLAGAAKADRISAAKSTVGKRWTRASFRCE